MKKLFYSTFIFAALLTSCGGGEESTEKEESTTEETHAAPGEEATEVTEVPTEAVSSKGNWNDSDVAKAQEAMASIDDQLAAFGDKKEDFKNCYLDKVMTNYDSFADADADIDGCSALAETCATDVMGL